MEYIGFDIIPAYIEEKRLTLLSSSGLKPKNDADYTVIATDSDNIAGCASICGRTVKYVAVNEEYRGLNVTGGLISEIRKYAFSKGIRHLFLYTKPKNLLMFEGLNFHVIAEVEDAVILEDKRNGITDFVNSIPKFEHADGDIGAIVMNANPFTLGHKGLVRYASERLSHLYVFVLDDDMSEFSSSDRFAMVCDGTREFENVTVVKSGGYTVSSATFPDYFLREKTDATRVQCELDCKVFGEKIAPALRVTKRFVGSEPISALTDEYNRIMAEKLPKYGIELIEIPRFETDGGEFISASKVREMLKKNEWEKASNMLPETTAAYLKKLNSDK